MFILMLACTQADDVRNDVLLTPLDDGAYNPFPSVHLLDRDGHLQLPEEGLPATPTPLDVRSVDWRTGFSPIQVASARLEGVAIDDSGFPAWNAPTPGEGSVLLIDRTDGVALPVMAELDAWEEAVDPTLLVRPLAAMPVGHDVAVVVTTDAFDRPASFDEAAKTSHYAALLDDVSAFVDRDDVALAWDFPVSDGTLPLRSMKEQVEASSYVIDFEKETDLAGHRYIEGRMTVTSFFQDDGMTILPEADGSVLPTGTLDKKWAAYVSKTAAANGTATAPLLLFGHGMNGDPEFDLDTSGGTGVTRIAEELGAVVLATRWRALDYDDRATAVGVANDFGTFPVLPSLMMAGQAELQALLDLARDGDLLDDPVFEGLVDPSTLYYYGISMGSIEGAVFVADEPSVDQAVLLVPGGAWSTMLERSRNWVVFEIFMVSAVPDPADRQLAYAMSQLWWDPVDPLAYTEALKDRPLLLQEAYADDAIHNIATEMLARSIDLPVLDPAVDAPWGLNTEKADLPKGSRALVQFDPMRGAPHDTNRPSADTGAHDVIGGWAGTKQQAVDFYLRDGAVRHYCGTKACSDVNRGD